MYGLHMEHLMGFLNVLIAYGEYGGLFIVSYQLCDLSRDCHGKDQFPGKSSDDIQHFRRIFGKFH